MAPRPIKFDLPPCRVTSETSVRISYHNNMAETCFIKYQQRNKRINLYEHFIRSTYSRVIISRSRYHKYAAIFSYVNSCEIRRSIREGWVAIKFAIIR